MSPLLSKRWRVSLGMDGWARASCPYRGVLNEGVQLTRTYADESSIASLTTWLTNSMDMHKRIEFILSNRFCRYAVLAWESSIRSHEDLDVLAFAAMEPLIDGDVDDWAIRLSPVRFGRSCLVCAIPNDLIDSLYGACQSARCSVTSISPLLPMALNGWMKSSDDGNYVVVCVETDYLLALGIEKGEFLWIRAFTTPTDITDLVPMLQRQLLIAGQSVEADFSVIVVGDEGKQNWRQITDNVHLISGQHPVSAMLELEC